MMIHLPSRIRDINFWYYQISGWIIYSAIQYGILISRNVFIWQSYLSLTIHLVAIFLLLISLRWYYRRLPFQTMPFLPLVSRMFIASFLVTVCWMFLWGAIEYIFFTKKFLMYLNDTAHIVSRFSFSFPIFIGWSALYFGIKAWRDWLNEQDNTRFATEAAQRAQFQMLRYQLNPHFLFNALNSVRALVDEDARSAKSMITELSEFLRYSLMSRNKPIVTLKEELDAIRLYLSIEQQRYEDKLKISLDIDKQTEDIPIPSFLIHPIVECALRCGMQTSSMPLCLSINSKLIDGWLKISVLHSGSNKPVNGDGVLEPNVEQVEARLKELFPDKYRFISSQQNNQAQTILELAITNGAAYEEKITGNNR